MFVKNAFVTHGTCGPFDAAGVKYAQSEIQYEVVYYGIYDSSITVGPQGISDIHNGPRSTEQYVAANAGFVPLYRSLLQSIYA